MTHIGSIQVLTDEISNWTRFCQYAAYIRQVRLDDFTDARIDPSVWLHLLSKSGGQGLPLVPRLQSLSYALVGPYQTSLLLFLSPSLRQLDVYFSWRPEDWGDVKRQEGAVNMLLRTACTACPELDDLRLSNLQLLGPLCAAVEGLQHRLRKLTLSSLEISDPNVIRALAEITTLECLSGINVKFDPAQRSLPVRGFRSLKHLSLVCSAAEDASLLLACIASPLSSLDICSFAPSPLRWQDELAVIGPMVPSLKSCTLELLPEPLGNPPEVLYMAQLLQGLFALRRLEAFSLLVRDAALVADDATFEALAKAWPRLASFALDGGLLTSSPTLLALAHFATHCPALHTLLLPHLTDRDRDQGRLPRGRRLPSQGALRRLSFYMLEGMSVHDPEAAGRVVWQLFPNLDIQGACRVLPVHKVTPAEEDEAGDEEHERAWAAKRDAGRDAWVAVLETVQDLQFEKAR